MRQPVGRVAEHHGVRHPARRPRARSRSTSPRSRASSAADRAVTGLAAPRPRRRRTGDVLEPGHPRLGAAVVRRRRRAPADARSAPRARRRRPGRPTCARSPASTSQPGGQRCRGRALAPRRRAAAPRRRRTPAPPRPPAARCRPRGWPTAGRPGRPPGPRTAAANATLSTRPVGVHRRPASRPRSAHRGPDGVQDGRVLDRRGHHAGPGPDAGPGPGRATPRCTAWVPDAGEGDLVRPAAEHAPRPTPGRCRAAPGPAGRRA